MRAKLNVRGMIDYFGGSTALHTRLVRAGLSVTTVKAVEKWGQRDSIRGDRLADIIALTVLENIPFDIKKFVIIQESGPRKSAAKAIKIPGLLD